MTLITLCLALMAKRETTGSMPSYCPKISWTKLAKLAQERRVSYDKLCRRIRKVRDQRAKGGRSKTLNPTQEGGLKRYISYLIRIG